MFLLSTAPVQTTTLFDLGKEIGGAGITIVASGPGSSLVGFPQNLGVLPIDLGMQVRSSVIECISANALLSPASNRVFEFRVYHRPLGSNA
jgi:hypothetical protein